MEPLQIAKQMIEFNKSSFDNTFTAMVLLQEQTEKMVNSFMEQANWLPEEGRNILDEWLATYKKGRDEFKKTVDESFQKVREYFAEASRSS